MLYTLAIMYTQLVFSINAYPAYYTITPAPEHFYVFTLNLITIYFLRLYK